MFKVEDRVMTIIVSNNVYEVRSGEIISMNTLHPTIDLDGSDTLNQVYYKDLFPANERSHSLLSRQCAWHNESDVLKADIKAYNKELLAAGIK